MYEPASIRLGGVMDPLKDSRCLVTGGAGFIGSTIVDQLLDAGAAEVVVLDNFVRGNMGNLADAKARGGSSVRVVDGDICDRDLVDELTAGVDFIFHKAA